jgi:DNA replicative helicase MCM subunit Mcm2 (Cdc46/Mcm family)
MVPYTDQIGLDFTMLQRFAVIFVLEDTPDYDRDENIALSMVKGVTQRTTEDTEEDSLDMSFIQKYLAVARSIDPLFTPAAAKYIAKMHADKRRSHEGDSDDLRSHRQVNSLWRLALAIARFELAEVATLDHIKHAERILAESLEEQDPGLFTTGVSKADRELRSAVEEGIMTFFSEADSDEGYKVAALHEAVSEAISGWRKPTLNEFEQILGAMGEGKGFTSAGDMYYPWKE